MSDWRRLLWGQLVPTHLVPGTSKEREGTVRACAKTRRTGPYAAIILRAISSGATTPLYRLNHRVVLQWTANGTLMQDLRQHAGCHGPRRDFGRCPLWVI